MKITIAGVDGSKPAEFAISDGSHSIGEFTTIEAQERHYHGRFGLKRQGDDTIFLPEENWEDTDIADGEAFRLVEVSSNEVRLFLANRRAAAEAAEHPPVESGVERVAPEDQVLLTDELAEDDADRQPE